MTHSEMCKLAEQNSQEKQHGYTKAINDAHVATEQRKVTNISMGTEQHLRILGVAICCDIADEIDSAWYDYVCTSGMPDEEFIRELAQRLENVSTFDLKGRFPISIESISQRG